MPSRPSIAALAASALVIAAAGCGKLEQKEPEAPAKARAQAKRQQRACASPAAYDRLKAMIFDAAVAAHDGDRSNLDMLADYSLARMEEPVVTGWDAALDITGCKGRLVLDVPPGAERAFGGERRLRATVAYTAQAAADGNGFVYRVNGAEPIVTRLASFNLTGGAFRPPAAIDEQTATAVAAAPPTPDVPVTTPDAPSAAPPATRAATRPATARAEPARDVASAPPPVPAAATGDDEAMVRAFYAALGTGDGAAASARIVPEKQASRAFSPQAISRFYGALPEPVRLTQVTPAGPGTYRVRYRYAAGRSRCDGSAIVRLTDRGGRTYIRSIDALNGC